MVLESLRQPPSVIGTTDTLAAQEDLTPKDNGKAAGYQLRCPRKGRKSP